MLLLLLLLMKVQLYGSWARTTVKDILLVSNIMTWLFSTLWAFSGIDLSCWQYEYDETRSQERIERQIKNAPEGQGTVRMLTREEWEEIQEVRPRTPFESKLARPNARLRTGEPLRKVRYKDQALRTLCFLIFTIC